MHPRHRRLHAGRHGTEEAATLLAAKPPSAAGEATVVGTARRRGVDAAVWANGYFGDVLELNDLIGGHASIGVVTAALALAEARGASGAALLEAVIRGIEVTARVYDAVYPSLKRFTEMGMVPVGIPSSIGAAAAAARLLELDERDRGRDGDRRRARRLVPGRGDLRRRRHRQAAAVRGAAGAAGVTAARYAQAGMTGPLYILESPVGYFSTVATAARLDISPWTDRWALASPRRKLHACCGYLHATLDAAAKLRERIGMSWEGGMLEVAIPAYTAEVVNKARLPVSATDARFHLQFCLALVMTGVDVVEPAHSIDFASWLALPEVREAMRRIRVVIDPALTHYHQCRVTCRNSAGHVVDAQALDAPRGSPADPLSEDEVVAKFLRLAGPVLPPGRAERFASRLDDLPEAASLDDWLSDLAVPNRNSITTPN